MLILDSDHLAAIERDPVAGPMLTQRLEASGEEIATTIVSVEEQLRGWLSEIGRHRDPLRQIPAYSNLQRRLAIYPHWLILPWNMDSAAVFRQLVIERIRLGTMDLKIASIAISADGTLLSRNLRDFRRVPGLKVEDWL